MSRFATVFEDAAGALVGGVGAAVLFDGGAPALTGVADAAVFTAVVSTTLTGPTRGAGPVIGCGTGRTGGAGRAGAPGGGIAGGGPVDPAPSRPRGARPNGLSTGTGGDAGGCGGGADGAGGGADRPGAGPRRGRTRGLNGQIISGTPTSERSGVQDNHASIDGNSAPAPTTAIKTAETRSHAASRTLARARGHGVPISHDPRQVGDGLFGVVAHLAERGGVRQTNGEQRGRADAVQHDDALVVFEDHAREHAAPELAAETVT